MGVATIMSNSPSPIFSRFRSLSKTVRVMATVIAALDKWRVYRKISSSLEAPGEYMVILTPAALETAEWYLIASAQEKLVLKELEPLLPEATKGSGVGDARSKLKGENAGKRGTGGDTHQTLSKTAPLRSLT